MDTIIFDMDGTLIDTEKYYNRCWVQAIREAGFNITPKEALNFRSLGRPFAFEYFSTLFGPSFQYEKVRQRRKELMEQMIEEEGLQLKPGARELLTVLKDKQIRAVIATATDMERTERYLKKLGIYDMFTKIVSATMVERGKPAPDVYLYACHMIDRDPGECIAVEDSPNGVRSAAAAGCRVFMVPDLSEPDEEMSGLIEKKWNSLSEMASWI